MRLKRDGSNQADCALAEVDLVLPKDPESPAPGEPKPPEAREPKLQAEFPTEIGPVGFDLAVDPFVGRKVKKSER